MSTFLLQKCAPVDHLTGVLSVSSAIVASVPTPAAAPAPPSAAEAAGPSVPVLGVRAVATEVAGPATLVASHAGVEATPVPPPGPRQGHRHPHPSATNVNAVQLTQSLVGVILVPVDHKGEAGD